MNVSNNSSYIATPTSSSVSVMLVALTFIGTGGTALASDGFSSYDLPDSNQIYTQSWITKQRVISSVEKSSPCEEFQRCSKNFMETYGFTVKQYSTLMNVTRATIYKWHDLSNPISKVQSRNNERLESLTELLSEVKERRRKLFADWLSSPLNENSGLVRNALYKDHIDVHSVQKLSKSINIELSSLEHSRELDKILALS